jgi:hypothetical protein
MLQILGDTMLIATRMDGYTHQRQAHAARSLPREQEEPRERRRGWFRIAGLLL